MGGHCPWAGLQGPRSATDPGPWKKKKKRVASRPEDGHCPWAGLQGPRSATDPGPWRKKKKGGLEARGRPLALGRTSRPEVSHCPWALAKKKNKKKVASRLE